MKRANLKSRSYRSSVTRGRRVRSGVALIEIVVAMVVTTIGLLGTAGMLMHIARRATQTATQTGRSATATQVLNRIAATPYDRLATLAGCTSLTGAQFSYTQCISVTSAAGYKSIQVIITPANSRIRPDTTYLSRSP